MKAFEIFEIDIIGKKGRIIISNLSKNIVYSELKKIYTQNTTKISNYQKI